MAHAEKARIWGDEARTAPPVLDWFACRQLPETGNPFLTLLLTVDGG